MSAVARRNAIWAGVDALIGLHARGDFCRSIETGTHRPGVGGRTDIASRPFGQGRPGSQTDHEPDRWLLVAQGLDGVELRGFVGGVETEEESDGH